MSDRCTWCGETVGDHLHPDLAAIFDDARLTTCSWCDEELADQHVLLVRSRGEVRVHDGFCGVAHLLEWSKAGGRYR